MGDSYIRDPVTGQEKRVIEGDCEITGQMDVGGPLRNYGAPVGGGSGVGGSGIVGAYAKFTGVEEVGSGKLSESGSNLVIAVNTNLQLSTLTATVKFGSGLNEVGYTNGVGPTFRDNDTENQLRFDVQSLSNTRTFIWPNRSGTVATVLGELSEDRLTKIDLNGNIVQSGIQEDGAAIKPITDGGTDLGTALLGFGQLFLDSTITGSGTTGAQTINKSAGSVNFGIGEDSLIVTCDKCSANSVVIAIVATNDSTAVVKNVVPDAGSFTIRLTAPATAETRVSFMVMGA